jgi:hypothetical protein
MPKRFAVIQRHASFVTLFCLPAGRPLRNIARRL